MNSMFKLAGALVLTISMFAGSVQAGAVSQSDLDLANWGEIGWTGADPTTTVTAAPPADLVFGVTNVWDKTVINTAVTAENGVTFLGGTKDYSGATVVAVAIKNKNENPWNYFLFIEDSGGDRYQTATIQIGVGAEVIMSLDLTSGVPANVDLTNIKSVGFSVGETIPLGTVLDPDRTAENVVRAVPEPGTLALLGAGMVAFAIIRRRRRS